MPGVRDYISYTDIPGNPMTGATLLLDEEIFAKDTVNRFDIDSGRFYLMRGLPCFVLLSHSSLYILVIFYVPFRYLIFVSTV